MSFAYKQFNFVDNKELRSSLMGIYGFGWHKSILVSIKIGLSYPFFISNLNFYNFSLLCCLLDFLVWSEVKILRFARACMLKHIELKSYKGLRFENKLPVNGQRTRSNARTCKRIVK